MGVVVAPLWRSCEEKEDSVYDYTAQHLAQTGVHSLALETAITMMITDSGWRKEE